MNHYVYRAQWSREYGEYVGRCIELPWLTQMQGAIAGVERAVDGYVAEHSVSMNHWVVQKSADRSLGCFDLW